jgi:tetratricopeptide (TPR) repeat protein
LPILLGVAAWDATTSGPSHAADPADPGPVLYVPSRPESVTDAPDEAIPLVRPGRRSFADTAQAELKRRANQYVELGRSLEADGANVAAVVAYNNALRLDPTLRDVNYRMGVLFIRSGQPSVALERFAAEVERHPDHVDATRELGTTLARVGQPAEGAQQLQRLLDRDPRDAATWHAMGFVRQAEGKPAEAEKAMRRAIALGPPNAEYHRDLGAVLAAEGRDKEARAEYRRALALRPGDPSVWYNVGNLERRAGHADSAIAAYRRCTAIDTSFAMAYQSEIQTLRELDRNDEAIEAYRRWLRANPTLHLARLEAVRLEESRGRHDAALELAREGVAADPRSGDAREILGMTLAANGRAREALTEFRTAQAAFASDSAKSARVDLMVATLRRHAPDSLRTLFASDSAEYAARPARTRASAGRNPAGAAIPKGD